MLSRPSSQASPFMLIELCLDYIPNPLFSYANEKYHVTIAFPLSLALAIHRNPRFFTYA
jgi:hypothetical protein